MSEYEKNSVRFMLDKLAEELQALYAKEKIETDQSLSSKPKFDDNSTKKLITLWIKRVLLYKRHEWEWHKDFIEGGKHALSMLPQLLKDADKENEEWPYK